MAQQTRIPTNHGALTTLVTVFFFWGFIAAGNNVFIPFCKHYFDLDQFQSQLIDFAFYGAYYIGALFLFILGSSGGKDPVGKWGYKRSIVYGLIFSAIGAAAMIIAVEAKIFGGMLTGLFIVALGFSLQQTAAQPFAISLGDPSTGTSRVNLGGGVNSFGTVIGPLAVAFALFGSTEAITDAKIQSLGLSKVIILYVCVGVLFIGAAALFYFSKKVPSGISIETPEKANKALSTLLIITGLLVVMFVPVFSSYQSAEANRLTVLQTEIKPVTNEIDSLVKLSVQKNADTTAINAQIAQIKDPIQPQLNEIDSIKHPLERKRVYFLLGALAIVVFGLLFANARARTKPAGWGAMQYPQLVLGMLAIFVYVGVEVAIGSNLSELLRQKEFGAISSQEAAPYVAMYWGSLMIGRWAGAISVFNFSKSTRQILLFVVPLVAFGIAIGVNTLFQYDMKPIYWYVVCVLIQIVAFYLSKDRPVRTLLIFSVLGIIAMLIGVFSSGTIAIYAFLSGGLWCSIMWPCIFNLSILGLGKYTTQGSAFLIMMILGGGIIPPIQGKLADIIGIHQSYLIAVVCFAYLALFAILVKGVLKKQGMEADEAAASGGH